MRHINNQTLPGHVPKYHFKVGQQVILPEGNIGKVIEIDKSIWLDRRGWKRKEHRYGVQSATGIEDRFLANELRPAETE